MVPGGIATGGNAAAGYGVDAVFCGGLVARAVITARLEVRGYTGRRKGVTTGPTKAAGLHASGVALQLDMFASFVPT